MKPSEKYQLIQKLKEKKAFWSFDADSIKKVSDEILIEKVLLNMQPKQAVKSLKGFSVQVIINVWKKDILVQEPYYHNRNMAYAKMLLHKNNPESYVKRASLLQQKKRMSNAV